MSIVIVGSEGFVGRACVHIFQNVNVIKIDPHLGNSISDLRGTSPEMFLICVPTPMGRNGKIDVSIVDSVMTQLEEFPNSLIVLKSTVLPEIADGYAKRYSNFVFNPEFLTERNAFHDAEYPIMTVIGGSFDNCERLKVIYEKYSICKRNLFHYMTVKEAALVKYGINTFLSAKVLFWNQFSDICEKHDVDYDTVIGAITTDNRIGASHTKVPGNDGRRGFGSACFSKDVPAFVRANPEFTLLRETWNANCDIRNSYDDLLPREIEQHIAFGKI